LCHTESLVIVFIEMIEILATSNILQKFIEEGLIMSFILLIKQIIVVMFSDRFSIRTRLGLQYLNLIKEISEYIEFILLVKWILLRSQSYT